MKTLTLTQAARNFFAVVNDVHRSGERTLLTKRGQPMVQIIPIRRAKTGRELAALWAKSNHLSPE